MYICHPEPSEGQFTDTMILFSPYVLKAHKARCSNEIKWKIQAFPPRQLSCRAMCKIMTWSCWYFLLYNVFLMLVYNITDANLILSCRDSAWWQRRFNLKIRPKYRIHWTDEPFCMEVQTIRIRMSPLRTLPYARILYYKDLCWPEVTCRLHLSRVTLLGNRIYREYIPRVNCWTVYCCAHTLHCKLYTVDTQTSV